jgi:hypothetical protein
MTTIAAQATRNNFRDFGAPTAGTWYGRNKTAATYGTPVTLERHGRGLTVRDTAGAVVDSFGDTGKFWFIPADAAAAAAEAAEAQRAEQAAANAAAERERNADQRAALAGKPAPEYATWVYDSETGERVGYLSQWGIIDLPATDLEPAPAAPVVIVPCGGRKAPGRQIPAGEKYIGSYHQATRRAAAAIAQRTGARILILSALYGLLELGDLVDDYDLRMGEAGSVTAGRVAEQAAALGITDAAVTVIAGRAYADVVTAVWPHAIRVLDGTTGMPHQMKRLGEIARGELVPAAPPAAVPALFGADLVAPPAVELSAAADLVRGDVLAPGTFAATGADPVLVTASALPADDVDGRPRVALIVRPSTFAGHSRYLLVWADAGVEVTGWMPPPAGGEYPLSPLADAIALDGPAPDSRQFPEIPAGPREALEAPAGDLVDVDLFGNPIGPAAAAAAAPSPPARPALEAPPADRTPAARPDLHTDTLPFPPAPTSRGPPRPGPRVRRPAADFPRLAEPVKEPIPMSNLDTRPARKVPTWVIVVLTAAAVCFLLVAGVVAATALGILGASGAAQIHQGAPRASAAAFNQRDPNGADACRYLDMEMGGIARWDDVAPHAAQSSTPAIRTATTERALYDACVANNAIISSWPGQLPAFD